MMEEKEFMLMHRRRFRMKEADAEVPPKSMLPPPIRDVAVRQSGASTSRISSLLV